jgi:hypothetical protein
MTVHGLVSDGDVICQWFEGNAVQEEDFPKQALQKVELIQAGGSRREDGRWSETRPRKASSSGLGTAWLAQEAGCEPTFIMKKIPSLLKPESLSPVTMVLLIKSRRDFRAAWLR